jgi:mRNA interferase HigB
MQIVSKTTLRTFWTRHPQARVPLETWYSVVAKSVWLNPADVKKQFGATVDFVGDNRLIFDVSGNKFRLIVHVSYLHKRVLIKFVGTHADYARINAETVR